MRINRLLYCSIVLCGLFITSSAVSALDNDSDASVYFELGGSNDPDSIGGSIGVSVDASDYFTWNGGLTYLASEHSSDVFGGLSLGMRTRATKYPVMPFVGFGVFSGITKETVSADDDGIDNNGDGEIDEVGEEDEIIDDVLCSFYPEVGLNVMLSKNSGMMVLAKHHFTSEGAKYKFWMYSMVFSIYF